MGLLKDIRTALRPLEKIGKFSYDHHLVRLPVGSAPGVQRVVEIIIGGEVKMPRSPQVDHVGPSITPDPQHQVGVLAPVVVVLALERFLETDVQYLLHYKNVKKNITVINISTSQ